MASKNPTSSNQPKFAGRNTNRTTNPKILSKSGPSTLAKKSTVAKITTSTVSPAKSPTFTIVPAASSSIEKLLVISEVPDEPTTRKESLPRLPYDLVLHILKLAEVENCSWAELIALRSLGEGWRLAVDNYHLPFCHKPASTWSPYISDRVPQDALTRFKGKHFKLPNDINIFNSMCQRAHNPFPNRELKIWCTDEVPPSVSKSIALIGNHIWSLTFVITSKKIDTLNLLYRSLTQMPFLEDLRVIDASSIPLNISKKGAASSPSLRLPESFHSRLVSLSVTGSTHPHILDNLLEAYGKGKTLKCLEVQGVAIRDSEFFGKYPEKYINGITKLKICGGTTEIFSKLQRYRTKWNLTHFTYHSTVERKSTFVPSALQTWLANFTDTLKELYLYWSNLEQIGKPNPKIDIGSRTSRNYYYPRLRKIGLPYRFIEWDCVDWRAFSEIDKIEYYDWGQTVVDKRLRNSGQIQDKDKEEIENEIQRHVWEIEERTYIGKIVVCFGKSNRNSIVAYGDDISSESESDYDGDEDDDDW